MISYMTKTVEKEQIIDTIESEKDENGYFTRTEYIKKENGQMIKRVSTIRKYTITKLVHKNVIERRENWKPFGLAASGNNNVTFVSNEEIFMEPPSPPLKPKEVNLFHSPDNICVECNFHHFTLNCPKADNTKRIDNSKDTGKDNYRKRSDSFREDKKFDNKDFKKNDFKKDKEMSLEEFDKVKKERQEKYEKNKKEEQNILKISNLPSGLSPADFYKMFSPGNVQSVYYNNNIALIKLKNIEEGMKLVEHSERHKFGYNNQLVKFQI
jgi:hypothetical protein